MLLDITLQCGNSFPPISSFSIKVQVYRNSSRLKSSRVLESSTFEFKYFTFNIMCILNPGEVILQELYIYFTVVCINSDPTCSSNTLFIIVLRIMSAVNCCQHISPYWYYLLTYFLLLRSKLAIQICTSLTKKVV